MIGTLLGFVVGLAITNITHSILWAVLGAGFGFIFGRWHPQYLLQAVWSTGAKIVKASAKIAAKIFMFIVGCVVLAAIAIAGGFVTFFSCRSYLTETTDLTEDTLQNYCDCFWFLLWIPCAAILSNHIFGSNDDDKDDKRKAE